MAYGVSLKNFPLALIVDGLISYFQFVFSNSEIVPDEYRWDADDRRTRIRISGPMVIDDEKPFSCPCIIVERGGFQKNDTIIDNLKSADENTFENRESVEVWDGSLSVTCVCRSSSEASSIANFLLINITADRHEIIKNIGFVRNFRTMNVGPEIPVKKNAEIIRYNVAFLIMASIQMGYKSVLANADKFNKFSLTSVDIENKISGTAGSTTEGSDTLVDITKSFGFETTNSPQLLEREFNDGWYYIRFSEQLYKIKEIVDEHTVRLVTIDENDDEIPWIAEETNSDVAYDLLWNGIHVLVQLP
jgi:hypothetical protein